MNQLKLLLLFALLSFVTLSAPLGYSRVYLRQENNSTETEETAETTNTTEPEGNYYNGVRCDWWCPDPKRGEAWPDPPTEEAGCICEVPDTRPMVEQVMDNVDAFLGGFRADDDFKNMIPCADALRSSIGNMNNTEISWNELNDTEKYGNLTEAQKFEFYLFNTT